mgnify:CR=1 FL=1
MNIKIENITIKIKDITLYGTDSVILLGYIKTLTSRLDDWFYVGVADLAKLGWSKYKQEQQLKRLISLNLIQVSYCDKNKRKVRLIHRLSTGQSNFDQTPVKNFDQPVDNSKDLQKHDSMLELNSGTRSPELLRKKPITDIETIISFWNKSQKYIDTNQLHLYDKDLYNLLKKYTVNDIIMAITNVNNSSFWQNNELTFGNFIKINVFSKIYRGDFCGKSTKDKTETAKWPPDIIKLGDIYGY